MTDFFDETRRAESKPASQQRTFGTHKRPPVQLFESFASEDAALDLIADPVSATELIEVIEETARLRIAVSEFSEVMLRKLIRKAAQGFGGWNEEENREEIEERLQEHWRRLMEGDVKQVVDVANFLMMLWRFNERLGSSK